MCKNNDIVTVVEMAAPLLMLVSLVLIIVGLTDLGQIKTFRFVLGEIAVVTAIAYSLQMARREYKLAPFGIIAIWFAIASMNFAQAAWFVVR